ncbi:hypothetical protein BGZ57DRAFT_886519 [Hyaloscypha finlandica]|nr:hypothetical protein BGZ57DRAFT_886519 [Hyaloscypha finlandica]
MLPPALILVPAWILVLPMTLVLACELALACIPLINLYQFSQIESWVAIMLLWITNECPSSSHAKAPFRLASGTSIDDHLSCPLQA